MVRTLWAGMATGTVVSAVALAAVSLLTPPPPGRVPPALPQQEVATPEGPSGAESAPALTLPKAPSRRAAPEDAPQVPRVGMRPDAAAPDEAMPSATPAPAHPAAATGAAPVALPSAATRLVLPEAPAAAIPRQAPQAKGAPALAPRASEPPVAQPVTPRASEAPEAAPNVPGDMQDPASPFVTPHPAATADTQEKPGANTGAAPQQDTPAPRSDAALRAYGTRDAILAERPVMSVIVIDQSGGRLGAADLAGLPFPVSVAVDMRQKDARHRANDYRSLGLEVLALSHDTVLNGAGFATVPEAVALLALGHSQGGADQVLRMLAADGRGLILAEEDTALTGAARKAGVPAAIVLRDLDGEGHGIRTIGRFLDQAAFRARQDGAALLMVRMRPETLAALEIWAMSERADAVQLRPVSALLLAQ